MYRCDGGHSKHVSGDEYSILNIWSAELYIQTFEKNNKKERKRKGKNLKVLRLIKLVKCYHVTWKFGKTDLL